MTGEIEALARRAVACKRWRWIPGMLSDEGRVVEINVHGLLVGYTTGIILKSGAQGWPRAWEASASLRLPDLTDPATLGCLLALVRKVWGDSQAFCATEADTAHIMWWVVRHGNESAMAGGRSEAEALVAALEAAS